MHDKKETKVEGTLSSEHIKQGFQEKNGGEGERKKYTKEDIKAKEEENDLWIQNEEI